MLPNHLILWCVLLLLPSIIPSIRILSSESALHIRWPKYWSFSFSIGPFNEYSRLISFWIDWFDHLAVQGTGNHHDWKPSVLQCSRHFMVQLSHPHETTGKTVALTRRTFVGKVMCLIFKMLSRFLTAFLPRSKSLLISWLLSPSAVFWSPRKLTLSLLPLFSHLFAVKGWDQMPWSYFFWVLSQLFHSALSLSSRGSLVSLCFLPLKWYHLLIWDCWYFSWCSWFQLVLYPA